MKRTAIFFLIIAMILSLLTPNAFAAETSSPVDLKLSSRNCAAGGSIKVSSDTGFSRIYIEWVGIPGNWTLKAGGAEIDCGLNGFQHEYVELPQDVTEAEICMPGGGRIYSISAFPADGKPLPEDIEIWEPQPEKADILVFATHPDDDVLFLGGAIATLAAKQDYTIEVVHLMGYFNKTTVREHERMHGLWALGVKQYPQTGRFDAAHEGYRLYSGEWKGFFAITEYVTEMIRRFKPQIVITQDLGGEYGHIRHKRLAAAVADAVEKTMDPSFCPESAETYGTWDVKKTYLHLYSENKIVLDLRQPIETLGGKTALQAAKDAYKKHVSQQSGWFYVTDDPNDPRSDEINAAYFGLYRTTVGADTGNDMTEHIVSYGQQERDAAKEKVLEVPRKIAEDLRKLFTF
ncbi:MAG: PIG-L family deacetylase [Firmicutes bacterium]|nr:PIG-L family deacetylase [Bacillota bacterium]